MKQLGVPIISHLAFVGFGGILAILLALLNDRLFGTRILNRVRNKLGEASYSIAFFLSLIATLASLFLSEILLFPPCVLCWYQRVFMYVQPVLWYMAMAKKQQRIIVPYIVLLNIVGTLWSLYHYSLHVLPKTFATIAPCAKSVGGVPCDKGYDMFFGFMTFPLMAAVVFVLNILFLTVLSPKKK